jgi:O-antigen/teichoic acid export membrane protein
MGLDFAFSAAPVAELLLIGAWINGLAFIPYGMLQGQGRPDVTAKLHVLEFLPFVLLLWFLVIKFGLVGAAAAWVLRVAVDAGLLVAAARFSAMRLWLLAPPFYGLLAAYIVLQLSEPKLTSEMIVAILLFAAVIMSGLLFDRTMRTIVLSLPIFQRLHRTDRAPIN